MRTFITLVLLLTLSVTLFPQAKQKTTEVDKKVQAFIDRNKNEWTSGHFSETDGKIIYDMIVKNKYTRAVEIGTGTGHSSIWLAWALSKTGGKLITIEINEDRYKEALARFKEAGLSDYIDARRADAFELLPALKGMYDFVLMDAIISAKFFDTMAPKLVVGARYITHGIEEQDSTSSYVKHLKSYTNFETILKTDGGFCTSIKKSEK